MITYIQPRHAVTVYAGRALCIPSPAGDARPWVKIGADTFPTIPGPKIPAPEAGRYISAVLQTGDADPLRISQDNPPGLVSWRYTRPPVDSAQTRRETQSTAKEATK